MQISLNITQKISEIFSFAIEKLPVTIKDALMNFVQNEKISFVDEIRIHAGACITLISNQNNVSTSIYVDESLLDDIFISLCDGSIYAHIDTIRDGYVSVGRGIRAGICGTAILENEQISGVNKISSVSIRLPRRVNHAGEYLYSILNESKMSKSVLLYSAPGVGKTTVLRDLIVRLSKRNPPVRHAVIDTKEEITPFLMDNLNANIYLSYPKGTAIELATKSMTPELIICDEISSYEESLAVSRAVNCGVCLIATTHARSFEELKSKEILKPLFDGNTFDLALGIERNKNNKFIQ